MKLIPFFLILLSPLFTFAAPISEYGKTPTNIAGENNRAYFRFAEALSTSCAYNVIYIDLTGVSGKSQLAILLAARASGRKLSIISYAVDASGMCWVSGLESE